MRHARRSVSIREEGHGHPHRTSTQGCRDELSKRREHDFRPKRLEDAGFRPDDSEVRAVTRRVKDTGAEKERVTIIGSRGQSPLNNRVIGSTARNLARTTVVPLLVNRIERRYRRTGRAQGARVPAGALRDRHSENATRAFDAFQYPATRPRKRRSSTWNTEVRRARRTQLNSLRRCRHTVGRGSSKRTSRSAVATPLRRSRCRSGRDANDNARRLSWPEPDAPAVARQRLRGYHRAGDRERLPRHAATNRLKRRVGRAHRGRHP